MCHAAARGRRMEAVTVWQTALCVSETRETVGRSVAGRTWKPDNQTISPFPSRSYYMSGSIFSSQHTLRMINYYTICTPHRIRDTTRVLNVYYVLWRG